MSTHFFLARCHTLRHIAHVMTTHDNNGRTESGADFLTLCGEFLAVLGIFALGALLLAF
jgi:hypothetical protein